MTNQIFKFFIYVFICLNILNCKNDTDKKKSSEEQIQLDINKSKNIYVSDDKTLEVFIENNAEFLIVGKPTLIYFKKDKLHKSISGINVGGELVLDLAQDIKIEANSANLLLTATEKSLEDGFIKIEYVERLDDSENFIHKINIPVK
ncbi:hypothetical protein [Psychroserpens mesophilus]|uniref:hypothetical protein n=1 Tax=Psychroserpens mesophilus TaxID=325473 RepID=UPI00058BEA4B|nr:hypothetical protein [Psychroserpens mesophilus]